MQNFKSLEQSEQSALAIKQGPRTVTPLEGELHPVKMDDFLDGYLIRVFILHLRTE